jgi:predicted nucleotidyltransferase
MAATTQLSPKLTAAEQAGLNALMARLREQYSDQIQQVILFGSKARNDSRPDSDTDLLILVKDESWALRHAIWRLAGLCQNVAREGVAL